MVFHDSSTLNAMNQIQEFKQSILIQASIDRVDFTITDRTLMHQWLNPALKCEPIGEWSSDVGAKSRFLLQIPILKPMLLSTVVERRLGLVVWEFSGFFVGRDRWECFPEEKGTRLVNCFEFQIPNPLVAFGFQTFAAPWTKRDMQAQLLRLKNVAERDKTACQT